MTKDTEKENKSWNTPSAEKHLLSLTVQVQSQPHNPQSCFCELDDQRTKTVVKKTQTQLHITIIPSMSACQQ